MRWWVLVLGVVVGAAVWSVAQEATTTTPDNDECLCFFRGPCEFCRQPYGACSVKGVWHTKPENVCLLVALPTLSEYSGVGLQPGVCYNSADTDTTPPGTHWTASFYERIVPGPGDSLIRVLPYGDRVVYEYDPEDGVYRVCDCYRVAEEITVSEFGYIWHDLKTGLTKMFYFEGWLYQISDANGNTCFIEPDELTGYPGRIVFEDGRSWVLEYDGVGKLVGLHAEDAAGEEIVGTRVEFVYDGDGQLTEMEVRDEWGEESCGSWRFAYDEAGRLVRAEQFVAEDDWRIWQVEEHEEDGRREVCLTDPEGNQTRYYTDREQNLFVVEDELGNRTEMEYTCCGRLMTRRTDAEGFVERWQWSSDYRHLTYTNQRGYETESQWDENFNLEMRIRRDGEGVVRIKQEWEYDEHNNCKAAYGPYDPQSEEREDFLVWYYWGNEPQKHNLKRVERKIDAMRKTLTEYEHNKRGQVVEVRIWVDRQRYRRRVYEYYEQTDPQSGALFGMLRRERVDIQTGNPDDDIVTQHNEYYITGYVRRSYRPYRAGDGPAAFTEYLYDRDYDVDTGQWKQRPVFGLLAKQVDAAGCATLFFYNGAGELTRRINNFINGIPADFDPNQDTDPDSFPLDDIITLYQRDSLGRIAQTIHNYYENPTTDPYANIIYTNTYYKNGWLKCTVPVTKVAGQCILIAFQQAWLPIPFSLETCLLLPPWLEMLIRRTNNVSC